MEWQRVETRQQSASWTPILIPLALLALLIWIKPVPLIGGIADDFKYLVGAQCIDCLPTNHWERRFAIIWPTGIAIRLFGQNPWSVMLFPIAAAILAVGLTYKLVEDRYGHRPALIASCVLVMTPIFATRSMRIGIDVIELVFLLGSVLVLQKRKGHLWAGVLMALAVLCRPTMLAALPMVAYFAWLQDRRQVTRFVLGLALPLVAESLVYLVAAGDPFYSWKLSLNHVQVAQPYLDPQVDRTVSPLFNPDYIGGWTPLAGIEAHWSIQGIVNLLLNDEAGLTLWSAILLCFLGWKHLDRVQVALIAASAAYFAILTYGFAIDPRSRMFLPIIVVAAMLVGTLAIKLWVWPGKVAVAALLGALLAVAVGTSMTRISYGREAMIADRLLERRPYLTTAYARQRLSLIRQSYPEGGTDLIHIDNVCPLLHSGRWRSQRTGNLCIYRRRPGPPRWP